MSDCSTWAPLGCAWVGLAAILFDVLVFALLAWHTQRTQR